MDLELARAAFISQHAETLRVNPELMADINFIFDSERGRFTAPDDYGRAHG